MQDNRNNICGVLLMLSVHEKNDFNVRNDCLQILGTAQWRVSKVNRPVMATPLSEYLMEKVIINTILVPSVICAP